MPPLPAPTSQRTVHVVPSEEPQQTVPAIPSPKALRQRHVRSMTDAGCLQAGQLSHHLAQSSAAVSSRSCIRAKCGSKKAQRAHRTLSLVHAPAPQLCTQPSSVPRLSRWPRFINIFRSKPVFFTRKPARAMLIDWSRSLGRGGTPGGDVCPLPQATPPNGGGGAKRVTCDLVTV